MLGQEEDLPELVATYGLRGAIVAVGDNFVRASVADKIQAICPDLPFVSVVHPRASIGTDVSIGDGTVVMSGATISPCCSVGRCCVINTNASLNHDSVMEDFSSLAPGATTGGNCHIGRYSAIGIGAVLVHRVRIGVHSVVGAGSTVLNDIGPYCVAYGTPAKEIRPRPPGEKYL